MDDVSNRFTLQVDSYIQYRPRYPVALLELLQRECGLTQTQVIADIGSGTGLLTELFLKNNNRVFGIEPNPDMRAGGEYYLRAYAHFTSVAAPAEATTLAEHSVDFVTVGQAFHWFQLAQAREEFVRILVPQGWVVLVWNLQRNSATPFQIALEQFWEKHLTREGAWQRHFQRTRQELIEPFYKPGAYREQVFDNSIECDFEGLKGRVLSTCSKRKALEADDARYALMLNELEAIFNAHQVNGKVTLEQDTQTIYGQLPVA